jgi:NAD(P)-dependent dehydrogenase (short-subunit alcohol dehydrogenase family)
MMHVYRACKAALNAIVRCYAAAWHPLGIACVALRPGSVETDMARTTFTHSNEHRVETLAPERASPGTRAVIDDLTQLHRL